MAGERKASADIAPRSAEAAIVFGESIVLVITKSASRFQRWGFLVGDNVSNQRGSQASRRHTANSSLFLIACPCTNPDLEQILPLQDDTQRNDEVDE